MYCAQCGEFNEDDNHYCENCGAFLDAQKTLEIRLKDEEHALEFLISSTPYIIGASRTRVNGNIKSRAVSRCHAKVTSSGEEFYIADLNSTNGTYVDDRKIPSGELVKLEDGMRVRIADYTFMVSLK